MNEPILKVQNLVTGFKTEKGLLKAVDDVSFNVFEGKSIGIVGESGCGKSVTSLSIMGLIPNPPGQILSGSILFENQDLTKFSDKQMQKVRGNKISMIFQEPMTSLNPVFTVGNQIIEAIELHNPQMTSNDIKDRAVEMFKKVGISEPLRRLETYPHELSGGMRQRVMIAMALSCNPKILIADEPTTALDVTIQAQILDLMKSLQQDFKMGLILITHDLGVVAETCDEVAIMYAGKIIEQGSAEDIFYQTKHQYTKGLLDSIPHFENKTKQKRLNTIPGLVPNLLELKPGCRFQERCVAVQSDCKQTEPTLNAFKDKNHSAACFHPPQSRQG